MALGDRIADEIRVPVGEEVKKLQKEDIFKVTGTLKPKSWVTNTTVRVSEVDWNGTKVNAITVWIPVRVRVVLDAGGWLFTSKVSAIETLQDYWIHFIPEIRSGAPRLNVIVECHGTKSTKERLATQKQADKLTNEVRTRLLKELSDRMSKAKILPGAAESFNNVSGFQIEYRKSGYSGQFKIFHKLRVLIGKPTSAFAEIKEI
jgi:hypothetical protein